MPGRPTPGRPGRRRTALWSAAVGAAASFLAGAVSFPLPADAAEGKAAAGTSADPAGAKSAAALTGDIVFSVPSRLFRGSQTVVLSTGLQDAEIRYTTDGSLPTPSSPVAGGPITVTETTRLRAQAFRDDAPAGRPGTALYLEAGFGAERDAVHDLPVVVLDDFGAGQPSRDEYADAAVLEFRPGPADGGSTSALSGEPAIATRAGVQLHGQSSAVWYEKKSYRIELRDNEDDDADYPLAGLPAESDWVLRGPCPDKSLIRDAYVYSLGAGLGLQAPRFRYVELYTNLDGGPLEASDYQGLYLVVEKIKDGKNRLDLKDLDPEDITEPKVSGGYLMKFELGSAKAPTLDCPGREDTCWRDLELIEPKQPVAEQTAWITGYLQRFEDALRSADPADPETGYPRTSTSPRSSTT